MTANDFEILEDSAAAFAAVLHGLASEQLDQASPCPEWSVKELVEHVITGNLRFAGLAGATAVAPAAADLDTAFQSSVQTLITSFSAEGVLERTFRTPMGERITRASPDAHPPLSLSMMPHPLLAA